MFDASLAAAAARALHPILPPAAALGLADVEAAITAPPDPTLGDLAFPCFKLAKALRKAPPQIATELAAQITAAITAATSGDPTTILARAVAAGPYVNLHLDLGRAAALVLPALARGEVPAPPASGTRVMIEYSQPNTHKAFHVGHLRNLCLGDALVRLLRHDGDDVVAANYLGDVGAHIAKCLWWYLDHLRDRTPPPSDRGEWLGELYSAASNQLELWEEQAKAGDAAAATSLAAARARTTELLQKLEARDPELIAVWSETREWSLADFAEIYAWCGVHFDRVFFESEVDEPGLKLVDEYVAKGIFVAARAPSASSTRRSSTCPSSCCASATAPASMPPRTSPSPASSSRSTASTVRSTSSTCARATTFATSSSPSRRWASPRPSAASTSPTRWSSCPTARWRPARATWSCFAACASR
jgi:arginyl-tRNA synthetase